MSTKLISTPATKSAPPLQTRYRCVSGVIMPGKNGKLLRPGELLPEDFSENVTSALVSSGHVEEITVSGVVVAKTKAPISMTGRWIFNPMELKKLSLTALNTMIAERDSSVSPYKDRQEAIRHLSQDFHG